MEFATEVEAQIPPFTPHIIASFNIGDGESERLDETGLCRIDVDLHVDFRDGDRPEAMLLETSERGSIVPTEVDISDRQIEQTHSVYYEPTNTTSIRVLFKSGTSWSGPIEFMLPSYFRCLGAHRLLIDHPSLTTLDRLTERYNEDNYQDAVFDLLSEINSWITLDINYQILNVTAKKSEEVRQAVDTDKTTTYLSYQILSDGNFDIPDRRRLEQVIENLNSLSELPTVGLYNVLGRALSKIESQQSFDRLWEFERDYNIARDNWQRILREDQLAALLGRATVEGDYALAENIIESWLGEGEKVEDIRAEFEEARDAQGETSLDRWKTSLRYAIEDQRSELRYAVANFLHQFFYNYKFSSKQLYTECEISRCSHILFNKRGIEDLSTLQGYQYNMKSGRLSYLNDDYSQAVESYRQALSFGLHGIDNDISGVTEYWPIYWIHKSKADAALEDTEYQMAIDSLQEGQNLLVSLEDTSDESKTSDFAEQLNALEHEIHGDRELENQNLNSAHSHYGRAIGKYRRHGMNDECRYLKQRRNLIKASLAEQEGDFSGAQEAHEEIANITNDSNFKKFNKNRVQIIKAKKQLNQLNIEEAKSELPRQPEATNIAYAEAQHIGRVAEPFRLHLQ